LALERRYRDVEEQLRQQEQEEQECERRREQLVQLKGVIKLLEGRYEWKWSLIFRLMMCTNQCIG